MVCEKCNRPMKKSHNPKIVKWGEHGNPDYCETIYTYYYCMRCEVLGVKKEVLGQETMIQGEINKKLMNFNGK